MGLLQDATDGCGFVVVFPIYNRIGQVEVVAASSEEYHFVGYLRTAFFQCPISVQAAIIIVLTTEPSTVWIDAEPG